MVAIIAKGEGDTREPIARGPVAASTGPLWKLQGRSWADSDSPAETSRPNKEEQSPSGSSEPAQKKDGDAEHSGESRNEAAGSSEAPRDEQPGRTPSIRFPARLTPDGRRISQLTDEERRGQVTYTRISASVRVVMRLSNSLLLWKPVGQP